MKRYLIFLIFFLIAFPAWAMFLPGEKAKRSASPSKAITSFRPLPRETSKGQSIGIPRRKVDLLKAYFHKPHLKGEQKRALRYFAAHVPQFEVRFNPRTGLPIFLKGNPLYRDLEFNLTEGTRTPKEIALAALKKYRALLRLENPPEEFRVRTLLEDKEGKKHLRLSQTYKGIPYFGKEITVHLNNHGEVYLIAGHYGETPSNIDLHPAIQAVKACEMVTQQLSGPQPSCQETELVIYDDKAGVPHLCWKVEACSSPRDCWRYFLDAKTGQIIEKYSITYQISVSGSGQDNTGRLQHFSVWQEGGQYFFIDTSHPNHTQDPNITVGDIGRGNIAILYLPYGDLNYGISWLTSSNPNSWPQEAVTVWYHLKLTYDYYHNTHGRCGMDNRCQNAVGVINLAQANAFYASEYNDFMFFGTGDGYQMGSLTALDVVAHEFTHGVTNYSAALEYRFQSGALNEAFSDIFAAMVDREDWLIGEDVVLVPPYNLRNLIDPHQSLNPQPATMDEYQDLPLDQDNGGVHINATIPAHLIYILAEELGLGREKVERICYKALTEILTPQSEFEDFCLALVQAAQELYGPNEAQAAREACNQVGIYIEAGGGTGGGGGGEEEPPIPPLAGEDYVLFLFYQLENGDLIPYVGVLYPDGHTYYLSETPAQDTRPAPYMSNGQLWALFVDRNFNLRAANVESQNYEEYVLNDSGEIWSVATTPSARVIVYTSIYDTDNNIYVWHPDTNEVKTIPIKITPPDATVPIETFFPDIISFAPDGRTVFFDCFNQVKIQGTTYKFWTIGKLDLIHSATSSLLPIPPQGYHLGNPAAAHTRPNLVAYDLWNDVQVETRILNLASGRSGLVWLGSRQEGLGTSGWPSFSGDDSYLYLQNLDPVSAEILIRVPLKETGGVWSGIVARKEDLLSDPDGYGIVRPVAFRKGVQEVSARAEVSPQSLDFGSVSIGTERHLDVILRNVGNYPLEFMGSEIEGNNVFEVQAVHTTIDPGQSYQLTVIFRPVTTATYQATLKIYTSDPENQEISVPLRGRGETGSSGGEVKDPPRERSIGMADPTTAPVKLISGGPTPTLAVQFYYSAPVDIIVGYLSPDFQEIKWLDPRSCTFKETFSWLSQQTELLCPLIFLQEPRGYLFWLVSPVPLLELDFEQGVYELKFYMLGD